MTRHSDALLITEDSTNLLVIEENENGKIFPVHKESLTKTNNFLKRLDNEFSYNFEDDIFPTNTKFCKRFNSCDLFVIEWNPSIRTITVEKDMFLEYKEAKGNQRVEILDSDFNKENIRQNFRLSFPYIIWFVLVDRKTLNKYLKLYFKLTPLSSFNDPLILPPVLNISSKSNRMVSTVCLGYRKNGSQNSDVLGIEDTISLFFSNEFNKDYPEFYNLYREHPESSMSNYFIWQAKTRQNPLFIFRDNWLVSNFTVKDVINDFVVNNIYTPNITTSFDLLRNIAHSNITLEKDKSGDVNKIINDNSIYSEIPIKNNIVSIGDDLRINNRICYLNSIHRNDSYYDDLRFEVEYEDDGTTEVITINDKIKYEITCYFEEVNQRITRLNKLKLNNGDVVKPGDFVLDKSSLRKTFKKVDEIIKSYDGITELKLGNDRVIGLDLIEKFSYKKLCELLGGKIKKGSKIFSHSSLHSNSTSAYPYGIYSRQIDKVEKIRVKSNKICIINEKGRIIHNLTNLRVIDGDVGAIDCPTVRTGLKLYNSRTTIENGCVYHFNDKLYDENYQRFVKSNAIRNIFLGNELYIKGTDYDINFKIGDEVVVSDWENIDDMLKIRKVKNFKLKLRDSDNHHIIDENNLVDNINDSDLNNVLRIYVNTIDENMNEKEYLYINFVSSVSGSIIYTPTIRKIIRNYNDFSSGDLVKSTIPKINGFPKKDLNKIIAFIDDTSCEYPLALMSNTYTIRCNDLENYFIKRNDLSDENLAEVRKPTINKQKGDMCYFYNYDYNNPIRFLIELYHYYSKYSIYQKGVVVKKQCKKIPFGFLNPKFDTLFDERINSNIENIRNHYPNLRNWYNSREEVNNV